MQKNKKIKYSTPNIHHLSILQKHSGIHTLYFKYLYEIEQNLSKLPEAGRGWGDLTNA
jgi:hypothetical protein